MHSWIFLQSVRQYVKQLESCFYDLILMYCTYCSQRHWSPSSLCFPNGTRSISGSMHNDPLSSDQQSI